jgi:hypothetical protein
VQSTSRARERVGAHAQIRNPYHHALNLRDPSADWIARDLGEFFAFARIVAIFVGFLLLQDSPATFAGELRVPAKAGYF